MFGHKKILPLGSQRVHSKQQQLYPAVWVKERGLILLPPPGQKPDLPLHAGVELLPVGVAAFTGCMFQQMLPQRREPVGDPWSVHGLSLTASSPCRGKRGSAWLWVLFK